MGAATLMGVTTPIRGEITEIVGRPSSGRTSHLVACLGTVLGRGETAALVDTEEAFDPVSAVEAGVDLRRLLWVRCGGRGDVALRAADMLVRCPGFRLVALDLGERVPRLPPTLAFRLKFAVRRTDVALLVVGRRRLTGSSATMAVETLRDEIEWAGPGPAPTRLARMRTRTRVLRSHRAAPDWPATSWWSA
jgi:recA bacterial DNA recombination protein